MPPATETRPDPAPPQTRRQRRNRFRGDIEGLRAVAVLLVVAFHAGVGVVSGGFVGVDVFFVLSGFLITGLLVDEIARTGTISLRDFYARRIRRLLPLSTLVLVATAAATFLLVPAIDRKGIAGDLAGAALWGANWRFAAESTQYMADTAKSPVLHYWSLSVEEQFYVVWPLLLLLLVGRSGVARRAWSVALRRMALALGLVVAVSLLVSWQQTASGSPFAYFGLHTRAWELGIGAALALARPVLHLMTRQAAHAAAAAGTLMVVGSAFLMDETTPFPGTAALVPVLGTALLVAAGARLPDEGVSGVLAHPVPRYIGRVSYAWYLWHWPVLVLVNARMGQTAAGGDAGEAAAAQASWPVVLAAVTLSFALAVASHYVVEQPLRSAKVLVASRRLSLAAGGALVAVSLVASGSLVVSGEGTGGQQAVAVPERAALRKDRVAGVESAVDPRPVTPAAARKDRPDNDVCFASVKSAKVEQCRFGPATGGTRTIALIGDSHAAHWRPAFQKAAAERGWTVYVMTKAGCSISDVDVWLSATKTVDRACSTWREEVLDRVERIDGLDAVVIGRFKSYVDRVVGPDGKVAEGAEVGTLWRSGSTRTFERLRKAAPRVVVLRDVPWPQGDVPSCLSQHPGDAEACATSRARSVGLDRVLAKAERDAAPDLVRFVDLSDVMCPGDPCQVVSPMGRIMFRDSHHLTSGYSDSLWRVVSDRVDAAIG